MNQQERASILASYGANASETAELLAYNHNAFDHGCLALPLQFPLAPEAHVSIWEDYAAAARKAGAFEVLQVLVKAAAENLEQFDLSCAGSSRSLNDQPLILVALACLTLEELACSNAARLQKTLDELRTASRRAAPMAQAATLNTFPFRKGDHP